MKISQGNSLCSYLKQTKMSFFFFHKIREQEDGTDPAWTGCGVPVGGGRLWGRMWEGEYGTSAVFACK
jgi:hypothetical protein